MSDAIEHMAYVDEKPWHNLGIKVSEDAKKDYQKFMIEAKLDWTVEKRSLILSNPDGSVSETLPNMDEFSYAIVRSSDQRILGSVGPRFTPLQNLEAFQWFIPFIESGECSFETAGALFNGSRVWILAKLNREPMEIAQDDIVEKYLLLAHAHDGSLSLNLGLTPTRVVCNNTLSMALGSRAKIFKLRHTQKQQSKMEKVAEQISMMDEAFNKTAESYRLLASRKVTQEQVSDYIEAVMLRAGDQGKLSTRASGIKADILKRVYEGLGQQNPKIEGTLWQAYNGITDYLSHVKGRNQENRLNALWFGDSLTKNQEALSLALDMAS